MKMNQRGQSALEYLMTYGWALIVIAIVVAVLIFVTSGATGGVTCQSQSTGLILKESAVGGGTAGLTVLNATGGAITTVSASVASPFAGTILVEGAASVAAVAKNAEFNITGITYTPGQITNAVVTVDYTTTGGLAASGTIVCNGSA